MLSLSFIIFQIRVILERVSKNGTRQGLHIRLTYGLHVIEIEDWDEDQSGESRVKAAVIEDKSAVHLYVSP